MRQHLSRCKFSHISLSKDNERDVPALSRNPLAVASPPSTVNKLNRVNDQQLNVRQETDNFNEHHGAAINESLNGVKYIATHEH